jgi:hypothetical protein
MSSAVMARKAAPTAAINSASVRGRARRTASFTFDHTFSLGLKSAD